MKQEKAKKYGMVIDLAVFENKGKILNTQDSKIS